MTLRFDGWDNSFQTRRGDTELGVVEFLNKPFTVAALTNAVGRVIDAASGDASTSEPLAADG